MPQMLRSIAVIALALGGLLAGTASRATPAAGPDEPGDRVIIRVDRNLELAGYVEDEDDELIVIRDPEDQVHSFVKSRTIRIIRLVDPKPGQRGTVVLRNGQTRQGVLVEDTFEHVLLEVDGMRAKLLREAVDYVVLEPTFQERYQRYKEGIAPNMHQQHLDLCRWLLQLRKYELAKKELVELLRNKPTPQAQRLLTIVNAQLALGKPAARSTPNQETDDPTAPAKSPPKANAITAILRSMWGIPLFSRTGPSPVNRVPCRQPGDRRSWTLVTGCPTSTFDADSAEVEHETRGHGCSIRRDEAG